MALLTTTTDDAVNTNNTTHTTEDATNMDNNTMENDTPDNSNDNEQLVVISHLSQNEQERGLISLWG